MKKIREYCTAYFISATGSIIPVLAGTHIRQVIAEPRTFGLTMESIRAVYDRYGEEFGSEKCARREIIIKLLEKGWTRVRIDGNDYINCQIGCGYENKRTYKNIMRLLEHIRIIRGVKGFRGLGLRIFICTGKYLVNAWNMKEAKEMLIEKITVKKDGK